MDIPSYLLGKKAGGGGGTPTLQDKSVSITSNGSQNVTADSGYDGLGTVGITTNVQPDLETKNVTITDNTTTTITPTQGKDGLSSVSITTNVAGDVSEYLETNVQPMNSDYEYFYSRIIKKLPPLSISNSIRNLENSLQNLKGITTTIPFSDNVDTTNVTRMGSMFAECSYITTLDLSKFYTPSLQNTTQMFGECRSLMHIDMRNFTFSGVTSYNYMFGYTESQGVPSNCEIIVKDNTEKTWITDKFPRLTNVKTVAEYEAEQNS